MHKNEIDIITLGCSKNLVDAERVMFRLQQSGYRCVHDSDHPQGEIAIINTCGFIGDAKEESINIILQFAQRKRRHQLSRLYVMGCLSERYKSELEAEIPEVDRFFGKFDYGKLVDLLSAEAPKESKTPCSATDNRRTLTTPSHYAYLKIAEGCNQHCSYCAIPIITGNYKSRTIEDILDEVKWLAAQGVRELQVIAQDLTSYGIDIYKEYKIAELIEKISEVKGIRWIRLHYAYPTHFPMDLLRVMRERDNVCKYLDIALQHCSDPILQRMRRHISKQQQTDLIDTIRREVPGIAIRTTMMVGFPGETEDDFNELCDYIRHMRFERMGAFAYCREDGTPADRLYGDDIDQQTKQRRLDTLMSIQEKIATDFNRSLVGKTMLVVVDREEDEYYVCRSQYDSPEVDTEILIKKDDDSRLRTGEFYNAAIVDYENFDLIARVANNSEKY